MNERLQRCQEQHSSVSPSATTAASVSPPERHNVVEDSFALVPKSISAKFRSRWKQKWKRRRRPSQWVQSVNYCKTERYSHMHCFYIEAVWHPSKLQNLKKPPVDGRNQAQLAFKDANSPNIHQMLENSEKVQGSRKCKKLCYFLRRISGRATNWSQH